MSDWESYRRQSQTSSAATASLVLGICGVTVFPLVGSLLALAFGYQAREQIDESGGRLAGRSSAVAGIVLGWVGVALFILGAIAVVLVITATGGDSFG
jgi:ABC-type dipeptide/oligopeptide/nickel transport system permease subunit